MRRVKGECLPFGSLLLHLLRTSRFLCFEKYQPSSAGQQKSVNQIKREVVDVGILPCQNSRLVAGWGSWGKKREEQCRFASSLLQLRRLPPSLPPLPSTFPSLRDSPPSKPAPSHRADIHRKENLLQAPDSGSSFGRPPRTPSPSPLFLLPSLPTSWQEVAEV